MFNSPQQIEQPANILVMGLGGAGCNLVNRLAERPPVGVDLVLANTDAQALLSSRKGPKVVFLGEGATRGLGAGADHRLGCKAAEQSQSRLEELFEGVDMVFLTAGMGGGTGTGAAPVAARAARRAGALVVAVVTLPFEFEGQRRVRVAREGVAALQDEVDTLLVLPNQKLLALESGHAPLDESFNIVDQVLCDAVRGMTEIVTMPGVINLDFADVRAVLENSGRAIFGMATAATAQRAVELALNNPLVGGSPDGAAGCLLNITAGPDMTLQDYSAACALLQESASPEAMVLCGYVQDDNMMGRARATLVATRVAPAENYQRPVTDQPVIRSNELLPMSASTQAYPELSAYERRKRQEPDEISFAPHRGPRKGVAASANAPLAETNVAKAASTKAAKTNSTPADPAASRSQRRFNASGESEKKSKWMDLPAIWRRARRGDNPADRANEG